jgi:hypothetical protein
MIPESKTPSGTIPEVEVPGPKIPGQGQRWRCSGCGNLTRFDVTRGRRTTEYWHFDLAGDYAIEDIEVLTEHVDKVTCRWCGRTDTIEVVERG